MLRNARLSILLALLSSVGQAYMAHAAIPAAPSSLTATATSETSVALTWSDNSTNENQFRIERSNNPTTGFALIYKTKANVRAYTNSGLLPATVYYYRVYAINAAGRSANSNVASAVMP